MARSPHAFVRGNTVQHYEWLEDSRASLPEGPPVWICGDCHVGNLGPIADTQGGIEIQIRDLDQTTISNPVHDLIRLALSLSSEGTLTGSSSGHPHRDPVSGETHAIAYDGAVWDTVRHVVLSPAGRVVRDQPIPVTHGPCIHDCALTARHVVVLDLPVTFSMRAVLGNHAFPFRWNPKHQARVGLLPRDGDQAIWCDVEPCFVLHVANAFDEGDRVVMDVIAYPTMFTGGASGLDALGRLERWTIDPARRRVERRVLDDTPQEFPRIDERHVAARHRFLFTVSVPPDGNTQLVGATCIYRHDLETGGRQEHDFGDGHLPGEFILVPSGEGEGAGWLTGFVLNVAEGTTDFVILDANCIASAPVAAIHLPHAIPPGFHGNWFAA